ncbi:YccF domain-containing protein [Roseomonas genomospecies 6]|uniref:Inner membrane protein YccF n=1 Tax=Roseomonas genomospecies 6 TaxID=214106 RepID=A0A9W7NJH1_9PROT|nr:YccF domain-containing protein [Roseomonas genomospecies 6]KAA0680446.1 YccF domain-containing protein [Roseomonas genomospecies 6]
MPFLSLLLNILWVVTGGIWMAAGWLLAAVLMVVTIVGIPWARSAFTIAWYTLLPFGQTAVRRDEFRGREDIGTGLLGTLGNILWFVLAGWWLALGHLVAAVGLAITIIGLPFAWAHLKLALLALWPVGTEIVTVDEVESRRRLLGRGTY